MCNPSDSVYNKRACKPRMAQNNVYFFQKENLLRDEYWIAYGQHGIQPQYKTSYKLHRIVTRTYTDDQHTHMVIVKILG